jgi:formylglycine-generating enzyme
VKEKIRIILLLMVIIITLAFVGCSLLNPPDKKNESGSSVSSGGSTSSSGSVSSNSSSLSSNSSSLSSSSSSNSSSSSINPKAMISVTGGTGALQGGTYTVTLSNFSIGKYLVTYGLWIEVYNWATNSARGANIYTFADAGDNGNYNTGSVNNPVTKISWRDAEIWCNARSEYEGLTPVYCTNSGYTTPLRSVDNSTTITTAQGSEDNPYVNWSSGTGYAANGYRLPTFAEYEWAARGGNPANSTNWNYTYSGSNTDTAVAWDNTNSGGMTQPVGGLQPNLLGAYDMSGNVMEWCWDWCPGPGTLSGPVTNPTGPSTGSGRVWRGGQKSNTSDCCTVSSNAGNTPYLADGACGFRVAKGQSNSSSSSSTSSVVFSTGASSSTGTLTNPITTIGVGGATSSSGGVTLQGRTVYLSNFWMAKYDTTYAQWYEVKTWAAAHGYTFANAGQQGSSGTAGVPTDTEPVTYTSWRDSIVWANALSEKEGLTPCYTYSGVIRDATNATACDNAVLTLTSSGYRLPTEAEFEYAARYIDGSSLTPLFYLSGATADFKSKTACDAVAVYWYYTSDGGSTWTATGVTGTANVGSKAPNALGLYDMSGNVFEWCWDWFGTIGTAPETNPTGASSGSGRVIRGGSFGSYSSNCVVSGRVGDSPSVAGDDFGFRLARTAQ